MQQFLLRCGVAAPVIYVLTVLVEGAITPEYSHTSQVIRELLNQGAPPRQLVQVCFLVYSVATVLFAGGMLWRLWRYRQRKLVVGTLLLACVGVCGILTYFVPVDTPEGPATLAGQLSIVLEAAQSLLIVLAVLIVGLGFRGIPGMGPLWGYSLLSAAVTGMAGLMAAAGAVARSPLLGVYDRVAVGTFLLWMLILALVLSRINPQESQASPPVEEAPGSSPE